MCHICRHERTWRVHLPCVWMCVYGHCPWALCAAQVGCSFFFLCPSLARNQGGACVLFRLREHPRAQSFSAIRSPASSGRRAPSPHNTARAPASSCGPEADLERDAHLPGLWPCLSRNAYAVHTRIQNGRPMMYWDMPSAIQPHPPPPRPVTRTRSPVYEKHTGRAAA